MSMLVTLSIITVCMFVIAAVNRERYLAEREEVRKLKKQLYHINKKQSKQNKVKEMVNLHAGI